MKSFILLLGLIILPLVFGDDDQETIISLSASLLKFEEGVENSGGCNVYINNRRYPTIGYGKICKKEKVEKISKAISYCEYLSKNCTTEVAENWLRNDIEEKISCLQNYNNNTNTFEKLSPKRKAVLISMAYQMGCENLDGLEKTLTHLSNENWNAAADEILESKWNKVGRKGRTWRHSYVMRYNDCCENDFCNLYNWKIGQNNAAENNEIVSSNINSNNTICNDSSGCDNSLKNLQNSDTFNKIINFLNNIFTYNINICTSILIFSF
eukprot:jgi/Orpsp1_1/1181984/evm.model.c7180000079413.1